MLTFLHRLASSGGLNHHSIFARKLNWRSCVCSVWSSTEPILAGPVHSWLQRWPSGGSLSQLRHDKHGHRHGQLHQGPLRPPGPCRPALLHRPDQQVCCQHTFAFISAMVDCNAKLCSLPHTAGLHCSTMSLLTSALKVLAPESCLPKGSMTWQQKYLAALGQTSSCVNK